MALKKLNIHNNVISVCAGGAIFYNVPLADFVNLNVHSMKKGELNDPDFIKFRDDGSGSAGTYSYAFDANTEEELFFAFKLPHSWKEGSAITPRVKWCPTTAGTGNVVWGVEIVAQQKDSVFGNTSFYYGDPSAAGGVAGSMNCNLFSSEIDMTGLDRTTQVFGRFFRDSTNVLDTYPSDALLVEFDVKFYMDKPARCETDE